MKQKTLVVGNNNFLGRTMVMYEISLGWGVKHLRLSGSGPNQIPRISADITDISYLAAILPYPHCYCALSGDG